jgi:WD40 repeat protein
MSGGDDGKLRVWHVGHERNVQQLGRPTFKLPAAISNLDISSDQQTLLATDANGVLTIWNLGDQQRIAAKTTSNETTTAKLSPVGTQVALVRANDTTPNSVHLWDYRSDEETKLADFEFPVKRLEFSPDGGLLVVAGGKDSVWPGEPTPVCVIELVKRRQLFQCFGHLRTVMDIRFLDDGMKFATSGSDRTVRLWDSRTGKLLQSWKPNKTDKHAYYFPRGRIGISNNSILAAYYNGSLVKMNQGQTEQMTIANIDQHLVDWFEVAADGETSLSIGLRDDFLAVLDIPTGKVRSYLPLGGLKKASFALSGDRLAIGDEQGQVRIMDIGPPPEFH